MGSVTREALKHPRKVVLKTGLKLNPKKLYGADGYAVKAAGTVWRILEELMMNSQKQTIWKNVRWFEKRIL